LSRVVVTGMGLITAVGDSAAANRHALINKQSGIGKATYVQSRFVDILPLAEVKHATEELAAQLNISQPGITRTDLLALCALQQAIADAALSEDLLQEKSTALVNACTVGGMCLTDIMYEDANRKDGKGSAYIHAYSNSANTTLLQQYYAIGGVINTFNTACSSSANAIMYGARLIQHGFAERAIVGGVDSLSKFTINGFNALMILSDAPCRPFDTHRKGLNLGEAAAFLVLEKEEAAKHKKAYAEIKGYGNSNDAFHPSSTSDTGDGPYLSMQRALITAGLKPADIDFINAHGTATENNDETESVAMIRLFEKPPAFASTKSFTGHTLGAAGAVEAVYSVLSLYHQEVYPSLNFEEPIPTTRLVPNREYQKQPLRHVMSNSFGFGGNCTSLIFSKL